MSDWTNAESLAGRAEQEFASGAYARAELSLRRALEVRPNEPEWLFNLGLALEAQSQFRRAAAMFARSFRCGEGSGRDAARVGACLQRSGEPVRAMRWFARAVERDFANMDAHVGRIECAAALGLLAEAEEAFFLAQQAGDGDARIYAAVAGALATAGQHERAVWCLREAARLDPDLPKVRRRMAESFVASRRFERARQLYLAELRRDPGDIDTMLDLGQLARLMNRPLEAAEKYRRVLELVPDHPAAHHALGQLDQHTGRTSEAIQQFDIVHRLDPDYPGVRRALAAMLLERAAAGDLDRARDLLRREGAALRGSRGYALRERDPSAADRELGVLLIQAGLPREAETVLQSCIEADPSSAVLRHHLAVARFDAGDLAGGIESSEESIRLDPRFSPPMHNLALAHMSLGHWSRARFWVGQARTIERDSAVVRRLRLRLHIRSVLGWVRRAFGMRPARVR